MLSPFDNKLYSKKLRWVDLCMHIAYACDMNLRNWTPLLHFPLNFSNSSQTQGLTMYIPTYTTNYITSSFRSYLFCTPVVFSSCHLINLLSPFSMYFVCLCMLQYCRWKIKARPSRWSRGFFRSDHIFFRYCWLHHNFSVLNSLWSRGLVKRPVYLFWCYNKWLQCLQGKKNIADLLFLARIVAFI